MTDHNEPVIEITWRYDPDHEPADEQPATAEEALFILQRGNRVFADLRKSYVIPVSAEELGLGGLHQQTPIAAVLGCADARVPLELVFSQPANDMFVVRVAGNVLDGACVGSIDFAINNLPSIRAVAIVGHTQCGAVRAAVEAYLDPTTYLAMSANLPLRSVVDPIMAAVRGADSALRAKYGHDREEQPGYRMALLDTAVVLNAAVGADALRRIYAEHLGAELQVVFGVYDLASRLVGLPDADKSWRQGLVVPPVESDMIPFVEAVVDSLYVRELLAGR